MVRVELAVGDRDDQVRLILRPIRLAAGAEHLHRRWPDPAAARIAVTEVVQDLAETFQIGGGHGRPQSWAAGLCCELRGKVLFDV